MVEGSGKTPHYVLRSSGQVDSTSYVEVPVGDDALVLFGFSDKPEYDLFISRGKLDKVPYPLVMGFLERSLGEDSRKLLVLDAVSAQQTVLLAVTFESVLNSLRAKAESLPITHRLIRDDASGAYRIQPFEDVLA